MPVLATIRRRFIQRTMRLGIFRPIGGGGIDCIAEQSGGQVIDDVVASALTMNNRSGFSARPQSCVVDVRKRENEISQIPVH